MGHRQTIQHRRRVVAGPASSIEGEPRRPRLKHVAHDGIACRLLPERGVGEQTSAHPDNTPTLQRMPNGSPAQPVLFGLGEREDERRLGHDAARVAETAKQALSSSTGRHRH
jgi:hypothetical protein